MGEQKSHVLARYGRMSVGEEPMGRKTKKRTKWTKLSFGETSENEEEEETSSPSPTQRSRPHHTHKTYPHKQRNFNRPNYRHPRSISGVVIEKKSFDDEEYTKITTPRQDVLFKKGYIGRKRAVVEPSVENADITNDNVNQDETPKVTETTVENGIPAPLENGTGEPADSGYYESEPPIEEQQYYYPSGYVPNEVVFVSGPYEYYYDPYMGMYNSSVLMSQPVTVVPAAPALPPGPVLAAVPCTPVPLQPLEWYNPRVPVDMQYYYSMTYPDGTPSSKIHSQQSQHYSNHSGQSSTPSTPSTSSGVTSGTPGSPEGEAITISNEATTPSNPATVDPATSHYVYPGYVFGTPVYNGNGGIASVHSATPISPPAQDSQLKRKKKRKRKRRRRVSEQEFEVNDEGSEVSSEVPEAEDKEVQAMSQSTEQSELPESQSMESEIYDYPQQDIQFSPTDNSSQVVTSISGSSSDQESADTPVHQDLKLIQFPESSPVSSSEDTEKQEEMLQEPRAILDTSPHSEQSNPGCLVRTTESTHQNAIPNFSAHDLQLPESIHTVSGSHIEDIALPAPSINQTQQSNTSKAETKMNPEYLTQNERSPPVTNTNDSEANEIRVQGVNKENEAGVVLADKLPCLHTNQQAKLMSAITPVDENLINQNNLPYEDSHEMSFETDSVVELTRNQEEQNVTVNPQMQMEELAVTNHVYSSLSKDIEMLQVSEKGIMSAIESEASSHACQPLSETTPTPTTSEDVLTQLPCEGGTPSQSLQLSYAEDQTNIPDTDSTGDSQCDTKLNESFEEDSLEGRRDDTLSSNSKGDTNSSEIELLSESDLVQNGDSSDSDDFIYEGGMPESAPLVLQSPHDMELMKSVILEESEPDTGQSSGTEEQSMGTEQQNEIQKFLRNRVLACLREATPERNIGSSSDNSEKEVTIHSSLSSDGCTNLSLSTQFLSSSASHIHSEAILNTRNVLPVEISVEKMVTKLVEELIHAAMKQATQKLTEECQEQVSVESHHHVQIPPAASDISVPDSSVCMKSQEEPVSMATIIKAELNGVKHSAVSTPPTEGSLSEITSDTSADIQTPVQSLLPDRQPDVTSLQNWPITEAVTKWLESQAVAEILSVQNLVSNGTELEPENDEDKHNSSSKNVNANPLTAPSSRVESLPIGPNLNVYSQPVKNVCDVKDVGDGPEKRVCVSKENGICVHPENLTAFSGISVPNVHRPNTEIVSEQGRKWSDESVPNESNCSKNKSSYSDMADIQNSTESKLPDVIQLSRKQMSESAAVCNPLQLLDKTTELMVDTQQMGKAQITRDSFDNESENGEKFLEDNGIYDPMKYAKYYQLGIDIDEDDNATDVMQDNIKEDMQEAEEVLAVQNKSEIVLHELDDSASECGSEDIEMVGHRYETSGPQGHVYVNQLSLATELLRSKEPLPFDWELKPAASSKTEAVKEAGCDEYQVVNKEIGCYGNKEIYEQRYGSRISEKVRDRSDSGVQSEDSGDENVDYRMKEMALEMQKETWPDYRTQHSDGSNGNNVGIGRSRYRNNKSSIIRQLKGEGPFPCGICCVIQ